MRKIWIFATIILLSTNITYATEYNNYSYSYSLEDAQKTDYDDPFESINRKIFIFNSVLDHFFLKPVAKGYKNIFGDYTRARVSNAVDNVAIPLTTVSYALQGNIDCTLASFWKFLTNTILGVGGIYDVAEMADLKVNSQTFGNVLAHYGVKPGPYVILPIYGSTNMRDIFDKPIFDNALNPLYYHINDCTKNYIAAISIVEKRAAILEFTDYISRNSPDPYVAIRAAIYQARETSVNRSVLKKNK